MLREILPFLESVSDQCLNGDHSLIGRALEILVKVLKMTNEVHFYDGMIF